jgi:hypothetical protein
MAERILYDEIKQGLEWYQADEGQRFERFLTEHMLLSVGEAALGRLLFAGGTDAEGNTVVPRPPTLVHGYPRIGGQFPCWALTLGSERTAQAYLGDDVLMVTEDGEFQYDPETGSVINPKGRRVEYNFNILVISDHPDVTVWYYHLLKQIIWRRHDELISRDLDNLDTNGADLAPDPRYMPSDMFARQLMVQIQGEEMWAEVMGEFGQTIEGIALNETGDGRTASADPEASVKGLITPYTTGS